MSIKHMHLEKHFVCAFLRASDGRNTFLILQPQYIACILSCYIQVSGGNTLTCSGRGDGGKACRKTEVHL